MHRKIVGFVKKHVRVFLLLILLAETAYLAELQWQSFFDFLSHQLKLRVQKERILILAPHPDDEVLGCAGIIQHAVRSKIPVKIVFLTYGDNNEWSFLVYRKHPVFMPKSVRAMGMIRHQEAVDAAAVLGLGPQDLIFLGYPDFKTLNIWYAYWGASRPAAMSMLTKVNAVPYKNAFHPGAPYKGESILFDLKKIIADFKPTKIFVSHPADFNADHKAFYLFARVALWDLEDTISATLHPYLIHYKKWPLPRGYHPGRLLTPPKIYEKQISWARTDLTPAEIDIKRDAIQKHRSQYRSTAGYLLTFIRSPELFGDFPVIGVPLLDTDEVSEDKPGNALLSPGEGSLGKNDDNVVGFDGRLTYVHNDNLVVTLYLSKKTGKAAGLSLYLFGYRKDVSFVDMPKIRIRFGSMWHKVFDQNKRIVNPGVSVIREEQRLIITVPLALLRDPQRILTSANTYLGAVPLDSIPWRTLKLEGKNFKK